MNYTQLRTQVAAWLNRNDLDAVIPDFIALAEERFNRQLRVSQMETLLPETPIVDKRITLDSTVADVKTLWRPGYEASPINPQSFESVLAAGDGGVPTIYAKQGGDLVFNGGGSVQGVVYTKIPAIAVADSNWLSTSAPSAYLFGALMEAALFISGDAQVWEGRLNEVLNDIRGNDQRLSGPLVARVR